MAQVNVRVDDNIKAKAESACEDMGLTMSAAINIFLTKVANERRIPFEVSADPFYSEENLAELARRIADAKLGRNMHEHELVELE
jgi:DNA-damage-inducible protein J